MTDGDLRMMLEDEWKRHKPPIPMGERRIALAISCMRRAYETSRNECVLLCEEHDDCSPSFIAQKIRDNIN